MPTLKKRVSFFDSPEGLEVKDALLTMVADNLYFTDSSYSANSIQHPDHLVNFVDKHMNYLNTHPSIDPEHYVSNLRLITKLR
ncbi:MAG: hypothetical protein NVS1B7_0800 [Candidatus Saccharimonadales bacterium]